MQATSVTCKVRKKDDDDALVRKNFMLSHTAPFEALGRCFDSLPGNSETSSDVCFVTNLRLPHHAKLRMLHRLCVIPALVVSVVDNRKPLALIFLY